MARRRPADFHVPAGWGYLLFTVAFVGVNLMLAWLATPDVFRGAFLDTDGYMRLVRVQRLAETGAWFDSLIPRSNWPYGEVLHWTRPLDVLILLGGWLAAPFVGLDRGLHLAGVFVSPALLLGVCVATAWAGRPLYGAGMRWFVLLAVLVQPTVLVYAFAGRPDHHVLLLLVFVLTLGCTARALARPHAPHWAVAAGVSGGLGTWVSPEFLLALAVMLVAVGVLWTLDGRRQIGTARAMAAALAVTIAVALVVERGPGSAAVAYERISIVHVLMAALVVAFWLALGELQRRDRLTTRGGRSVAAALVGAACLGVMALVFPDFYQGPMVAFDHPAVRLWLRNVSEFQPRLMPDDLYGLGAFIGGFGALLFVVPFFAVRWVREGREGPWEMRTVAALALGVFVPMGLAQVRWATYAQLIQAVLLTEFLAWVWGALPGESFGARLKRAAVAAFLLLAPFSIRGLLRWVDTTPAVAPEVGALGPRCDYTEVARRLGREPGLASPRTVAASMDLGPAILYLTPHRVLATPYANESGIVAVYDLFNATDDARAREIVAERDVDLLLLCPRREWGFFVPVTEAGDSTLYGRLLAGRPPRWVRPVPLDDPPAGIELFEVVGSEPR